MPKGADGKRLKAEMTASAFRDDMLEFVEKHGGRIGYVHRSANGYPKLMLVGFGPRTLPTFQLEIKDRGRPEDPLERKERERKNMERAHDRHASDIQEAVKEALEKQKRSLAVEWGITPAGDEKSPRRAEGRQGSADERWSKRSFTDHVIFSLGLGDRRLDSVTRDGSNVIMVDDGDQAFKITVSMPRKK
jgi:hypothetical protein